jgi:hypothetical protein
VHSSEEEIVNIQNDYTKVIKIEPKIIKNKKEENIILEENINNKFEKNKIGSNIDLGDFDFKIVSIKEVQEIKHDGFETIDLLNPKATEGAKFVVLNIEIKSKLKEKINFS